LAKKLKRILGDKRAITPVLSNLLLTAIAVTAMSIATTATYIITTNLREAMGERLIVEDLWFNPSGDVSIYIRNVGETSVQVTAAYVNHTNYSFTPTWFVLEVDEHGWLNVSCSWVSGNVYYVDIVTTRGYHVADYYNAS
jgi:hypothetical protein